MSSDNLFAQHLPSNIRTFTDEHLLETTNQFSYHRNQEEIEKRKNFFEYVTVSDKEMEEVRLASKNTLTRGDCVAIILAKKFKDYTGMSDPNKEEDDGKVEKFEVRKKKKIDSSFYCFDTHTTYYFLM